MNGILLFAVGIISFFAVRFYTTFKAEKEKAAKEMLQFKENDKWLKSLLDSSISLEKMIIALKSRGIIGRVYSPIEKIELRSLEGRFSDKQIWRLLDRLLLNARDKYLVFPGGFKTSQDLISDLAKQIFDVYGTDAIVMINSAYLSGEARKIILG